MTTSPTVVRQDISAVARSAAQFKRILDKTKKDLGSVDFDWYPYDTLANLIHLDKLLTGRNRFLLSEKKLRILDVGCQDGELAFFFESLGHEVVAVDHCVYNHNGMRGLRTLKEALGSSVEIHELDIDSQFALPHDTYDLVLLLGVLYHLRNPFYALEELARRASYCVLSTRVARRFPDGTAMPEKVSMAYLLDELELNEDNTNYFIFSESGLRTMLKRTHWDVADYLTPRSVLNSDPVRSDRDERAFCLLKSRYDRLENVDLLSGWHISEGTGWRWTERSFSARVRWNGAMRPRAVRLQIYLPDHLVARLNPLRLSATVNGVKLTPELYRTSGPQKFERTLTGDFGQEMLFQFELSGALPPDENDERELGVIVQSIRLE
jgi:SAM-dependent methyltransferase